MNTLRLARVLTSAMLTLAMLAMLAMLAGCAELPHAHDHTHDHARETPSAHAAMREAAALLLDGIQLYDNGHFTDAIATLGMPAMGAAPEPMRVEALKYTAFSYCVMDDYGHCRHAFERALAIDAGFELSKSERGHPMWGSVFDAAKAASEQERAHSALDGERERWRGIDLWRAR
jgi:hypothetical protein